MKTQIRIVVTTEGMPYDVDVTGHEFIAVPLRGPISVGHVVDGTMFEFEPRRLSDIAIDALETAIGVDFETAA